MANTGLMQLINPANRSTKFLMCHGLDDEVVDPRWGKVSYDKLVQLGLPGKWIEYPGTLVSFYLFLLPRSDCYPMEQECHMQRHIRR